MRWLSRVLLWALLCAAGAAHAQDVLPVPPLSARVIDQTGTLAEPQRAALEAKLAAFEAEAGPQIVVVLVPTTQPEDIASYTQRLGDAWKIGRRDVGDGLLFVVAKNDRRVWIAPAKALEGAVPDLAARQIIERHVTPAFRNNDFAGGVNAGVDALMARIRGENLPAPQARVGTPANEGVQWDELLMFFFIGVPVLGAVLKGVLGRKLGTMATAGGAAGLAWWLTASLALAAGVGLIALLLVGLMGLGGGRRGFGGGVPIIWGGGGGGGWGGGGGGGFSSGGGGDFGGGGAGGSW